MTSAALSGTAVDALHTLQTELSGDYSELRSAEVQLAEALLSAHAVTVSGRGRLQDIQRQLVEAITNPVAALDTPAGERQFLMFLRGKVAEILEIVDSGALTDEDHARVTHALGSGYLLPPSDQQQPGAAPVVDQAAGMLPALTSALGALPQAAQAAAGIPAQLAGMAGSAVSPLAGLVSGLAGHGDQSAESTAEDRDDARQDDLTREETRGSHDPDASARADAHPSPPPPPPNTGETPASPEPAQGGPAPTRPASRN